MEVRLEKWWNLGVTFREKYMNLRQQWYSIT